MRTSGRTILFSGTIVMISLFSLFIVKSPLFIGMALGAVLVVVCTLLTAWTMLPALLAALGDRVNRLGLPKRLQPATDPRGRLRQDQRLGQVGAHRPQPPLAGHSRGRPPHPVRPAHVRHAAGHRPGPGGDLRHATGKAEIILTEKFSPGLLSPIQILASHEGSGALTSDDLTTIDKLTNSVAKDKRVAGGLLDRDAARADGGRGVRHRR